MANEMTITVAKGEVRRICISDPQPHLEILVTKFVDGEHVYFLVFDVSENENPQPLELTNLEIENVLREMQYSWRAHYGQTWLDRFAKLISESFPE